MAQHTIKFTVKQDGPVPEEVEKKLGDVVNRDFLPAFYQELDFQEVIEEFTHDSEGC